LNIRKVSVFLTAGLLASLLASAVIFADDTAAGDHRRSSAGDGRVDFVSPSDGDAVAGTFRLQFSVSGMEISPAGTDLENTGHHHLLIDVDELPDFNLPVPKNDHFVHFGGGQTETEITLAPGKHTLQLLFADYAHIPHHPVVMSEVITVYVSETPEAADN
jgi:hypothetical protein